jgi:hypothetical protein
MTGEPGPKDERTEALVVAVFVRATHILDVEADLATVRGSALKQIDVDFLDDPIDVAGVEVDSLGLVDILATVEAELDLVLFDQDDVELLPTLRSLGSYILEEASSDAVDRFLQAWREVPGTRLEDAR